MSDELHKALAGVRAEIDGIDAELLRLLNQRARCAQKVGAIKAEHGEAGHIYRPEREAQVLRRLQEANPGPLPGENITFFFREVMSACLALEEPLGIAFLGPLGTFSESAATKHFGHAARLLPQVSIDDVFREVESGHAQYAVVPVENSTEGAVGRTMDLLLATPLRICGELVLRIHQHLLSSAADMGAITKVYSHAQSLAQCHEWLNRMLPNAQRIPVGSNAQAAQNAAAEAGAAAIAGEAAAARYKPAAPRRKHRGRAEQHDALPGPRQARRRTVRPRQDVADLSAPNRTGALHELLLAFAHAGVSMSRLESRPARHALWEYVFYVDIDGHRDDPAVKTALDELAAAPPI